jgi:hypothetical protein
MSLEIFSIQSLPRREWDCLTANSFLSSADFAGLWSLFAGRPVFLAKTENGKMIGGMTGVIFGRSFYGRFKSMPDGLAGGPIMREGVDKEKGKELIEEIIGYFEKKRFARVDIYSPIEKITDDFFQKRQNTTQIIMFENGKYQPSDSEVPRHIRHGQKEGGVVSEKIEERDLGQFYELVEETSSRHGQRPRYTPDFFRALRAIAEYDERVIWPVVYCQDMVVASHIYFLERGELLHWQGFSARKHWSLKPNHLLLNFIIEYCLKQGIGRLDLGGSPAEAKGLREFKEGWGGIEVPRDYYTHLGGLGRLYYWGKRA